MYSAVDFSGEGDGVYGPETTEGTGYKICVTSQHSLFIVIIIIVIIIVISHHLRYHHHIIIIVLKVFISSS